MISFLVGNLGLQIRPRSYRDYEQARCLLCDRCCVIVRDCFVSKCGVGVPGKHLIILRWFLEALQGKVYLDLMMIGSFGLLLVLLPLMSTKPLSNLTGRLKTWTYYSYIQL